MAETQNLIHLIARQVPRRLLPEVRDSRANLLVSSPLEGLNDEQVEIYNAFLRSKGVRRAYLQTDLTIREVAARIMLNSNQIYAGDPAFCFPESTHDTMFPMFMSREGSQIELTTDVTLNPQKYKR